MGKPTRAWSIGLAGLTALGMASPWAAWSSPVDRLLPATDDAAVRECSCVRLEFAEREPAAARRGEAPAKDGRGAAEALKIPSELPGAAAANAMPLFFDTANARANEEAILRLFPPLQPGAIPLTLGLGPEGRPVSLDDLERYAAASSPYLRRAAAGTTAVAPNRISAVPFVRSDAKAKAPVDVELANLALARAEADVKAEVRRGYFAVLAAQENIRVHEAFADLAEDAYSLAVERAIHGRTSVAEPLQLRPIAIRARSQVTQARNRHIAAWKQLAAVTGRSDLAPSLLDGRIDRPLPVLDYRAMHDCAMSRGTDLAIARASVERARQAYARAAAAPMSILDRAGLARTRKELAQAEHEPDCARAALAARLAAAFERYDTHRRALAEYRESIVPDRVKALRLVAARSNEPSYDNLSEIVSVERDLAESVAGYTHALDEAWSAVVDIARLTESRDLRSLAEETCETRLPGSAGEASTGIWPVAMPTRDEPPHTTATRLLPSVPAISSGGNGPCSAPGCRLPSAVSPVEPASGAGAFAPASNVERSTLRRRFFAWPPRRPEGETPLVLPPGDSSPCCPPTDMLPNVAPSQLPQPKAEAAAPPPKMPQIVELPDRPDTTKHAVVPLPSSGGVAPVADAPPRPASPDDAPAIPPLRVSIRGRE